MSNDKTNYEKIIPRAKWVELENGDIITYAEYQKMLDEEIKNGIEFLKKLGHYEEF